MSLNDRGLMTAEAFLNPRAAVITPVLILVGLAWYVAGVAVARRLGVPVLTYLRDGDARVLLGLGALRGRELLDGDWWRLLTAGFVHVGAVHLLVNLFSLGVLGPLAEGLWGRKRFVVLYLLSGLGAACVAVLVNPDAVTAAAAGSVWGTQAAVLLWLARFREYLPPALLGEWLRWMLLVAAVNAVVSLTPSVSWQGHAAGAAVGFAAAVLLDWARWGTGRVRYAAGVAGLIALTAGLLVGLWIGSHSLGEWKALRHKAAPQAGRGRQVTGRLTSSTHLASRSCEYSRGRSPRQPSEKPSFTSTSSVRPSATTPKSIPYPAGAPGAHARTASATTFGSGNVSGSPEYHPAPTTCPLRT